jgi:hypothetical protein
MEQGQVEQCMSPVERRTAVEDLNLLCYDVVWIGK